jgi:molybdate/tungstate transport system substrate-binding protein
VEWYLVFAANELVLSYSPASRSAGEMRETAEEDDGWLRLLQAGYRLGRPDPDADPKGYRTLFALQLAEERYGLSGLVANVAGAPRNPEQLVSPSDLAPMLQRGELDLAFSYASQARESGLPFISLPEDVNLGSPALATVYMPLPPTSVPMAQSIAALL